MKKLISVFLAVTMLFVMCISAFAAEKPQAADDVAAWTEYYAELLADETADPLDVASEVVDDIDNGIVDEEVAIEAIERAALRLGTDYADEVVATVSNFLGLTGAPTIPDLLPDDDEGGLLSTFFGKIADFFLKIIGFFAGFLFGKA